MCACGSRLRDDETYEATCSTCCAAGRSSSASSVSVLVTCYGGQGVHFGKRRVLTRQSTRRGGRQGHLLHLLQLLRSGRPTTRPGNAIELVKVSWSLYNWETGLEERGGPRMSGLEATNKEFTLREITYETASGACISASSWSSWGSRGSGSRLGRCLGGSTSGSSGASAGRGRGSRGSITCLRRTARCAASGVSCSCATCFKLAYE